MLVQQLNAKGRPREKYAEWSPDFYEKMVAKWGKNLRWRMVPVQQSETNIKPIKRKKK